MSNQMISERPLLQRALQFPLTRLLILGGIIFFLMAWTEEQMLAVKDSPAFALAIALVMSFVALAIYTGWGRLIERRDVSELSTPGLGRECATGILIVLHFIRHACCHWSHSASIQLRGLTP